MLAGIAAPQWWMPASGSLHGHAIDAQMQLSMIAMASLLIASQAILLFCALRRKRTSSGPGNTTTALLLSATLVMISAGFILLLLQAQQIWAAQRFQGADPSAMQVEVVGQQFVWYFRYPGQDGVFGTVRPELVDAATGSPLGIDPGDPHGRDDFITNQLVVPIGRQIDLRVRAHDVIHGFFIPGMRLKLNAVPGMVLHVHFTPTAIGSYPILCTQVCGSGHYRMQAQLRVVSGEDFVQWRTTQERVRHE